MRKELVVLNHNAVIEDYSVTENESLEMNSMKSKWKTVKLNELCSLSIDKEPVKEFDNYRLVGIRLWGQGLYERESIIGHSTQYNFFTKSKTGNLLFNKIWARNGAISVVQQQHNGLYVSPEFPVYSLKDRIIPDWMYYYTKYYKLWEFCDEKSRGTSGKSRIKPECFLDIHIPLPPHSEQKRIVKIIKSVEEKLKKFNELNKKQEKDIKNTLYSAYIDLIKGEEYMAMRVVAPINRRKVEVEPNTIYNEIGVRSFGRGTFEKPSFKGSDLTWQKPYWMKEGDLLFSNIKAWEGAVSLIRKNEDGKVGSHRYITCKPNQDLIRKEFLLYHLLLPTGIDQLSLASPGTADRNRTLNTKKLEAIKVPVPKIEKQEKFEKLLNQFKKLKTQKEEQEKKLSLLIPSLLDKAFKGGL